MASFNSGSPTWVCFINGLEVPIIGASTTTQSGGLATSQMTMPYSPFLNKLPKNTKILLLSYDPVKQNEPEVEFDGVIQAISWRKDKSTGNTALFVMAQTDGIIWSERKKFNFYLDTGFSIPSLLRTTQEYETYNTISSNPVSDPLAHVLSSNHYDAGEITSIFLTHVFNKTPVGSFVYTDCGYTIKKTNDTMEDVPDYNLQSYAVYIKKFYEAYQVVRKLCRVPIPQLWKDSFQVKHDFDLFCKSITPLEGEVNFWNYITYICEHFNFEVYDIPDCPMLTVPSTDMQYINKGFNTVKKSILAEYLIKPKSPFGPIPYSNIIFPDQVLDKSFFKNFQNETTRCWTAIKIQPFQTTGQTAGAVHQGLTAPHFKDVKEVTYFGSFNVANPDFDATQNDKKFLVRNAYENEFGVASRQVQLPELLARLLTTQNTTESKNTLYNMMNNEFFTAYTNKVQFTMQVSPDVDIIPGNSILVLDESDDHILAYCYGREKVWDKNGNIVINLKLMYPRHYTLEAGYASRYLNTFDPVYYKKTSARDVSILEKFIGCKTVDQAVSIKTTIIKLMKEWNETYNQNTTLMKSFSPDYKRSRTTYSQYLSFHGIDNAPKYDFSNPYNKMPEQLVNKWDISKEACTMAALQYTYAENGYKDPQSTASKPGFKPVYDDLNTPGPIEVSTYIQGIVNCHNRYLMQVGNSIT